MEFLTKEEANEIAAKISKTVLHGLGGHTLDTIIGYAIYFGYTGRKLEDEDLRFLTTRGAERYDESGDFLDYDGSRNRPVLVWQNGNTITQVQATRILGFKFVELFASTLKINARRVEDALQRRFQRLPLGTRLWRQVDRGAKYDKALDGKVHKTFLTFSPLVDQAIRDKKIKIQY
mgnify:CR=1 FL=1